MKTLYSFILVFFSMTVLAQKADVTSDAFKVTGLVKKELVFSLADIEKYTSNSIADVTITNHMGEPRGTATKLTGILVKDILKDLELQEQSPKLFSEFYLVFVAADNYKVVYSWNEIFNSPTGDNLYLITSRDGKSLKEMEERILILTPTDFKTGRRHIKGLSKIIVERVD